MPNAPVLIDSTSGRIFSVRGKRVILDSDLAGLYGVPTKRLNEQVRRNPERFPPDSAFLLTSEEWDALRSQIATLKAGRGHHRKFLPYAFTEHGALMAASVLNSPRAIEVSIFVVRTFIAMRERPHARARREAPADRIREAEGRIAVAGASACPMNPPSQIQAPCPASRATVPRTAGHLVGAQCILERMSKWARPVRLVDVSGSHGSP